MQQIEKDEYIEWLRMRDIDLSARTHPILRGALEALQISTPSEGGPATALAYLIGDLERDTFSGGMVVLREWNLWSPGLEEIGHKCISLMLGDRNDLNPNVPLAVVFSPSEAMSVQAVLLQAMIFQWDAFYVPDSGSFLIFMSHDGEMYLVPNEIAFTENVNIQLKQFDARSVPIPQILSSASLA